MSRPRDLSDDDEEDYNQQRGEGVPRKKGGYDSRVEQILYENPDLQIIITDAGKSLESGGSYIVYTIRTGVCLVSQAMEKLAISSQYTGLGGSQAVLRVQLIAGHAGQPAPYPHHTSHSREAFNGRLCGQANEGKRGHGHHRPEETNVDSLPQSLPEDERRPGGWCVVEVPRPEC